MSVGRSKTRFRSLPCVIGCGPWCRKYFWEGQLLEADDPQEEAETPRNPPWYTRFMDNHRRLVAMAIPFILFHFCWWGIAIKYNIWHLFRENYFMTITMVFGSVIAGMTSEGGSSVAFPVMTLAFNVDPIIAKDFSLMIQSCGMVCAAFSIIYMKVKLEWHAILFCSLGGIMGTILGLEVIDPKLSAGMKKMGFVSIWFSFAFSLFLLNLYHKRKTYHTIPEFGLGKTVILLATGITGGIFTSVAGSGLDICTFSMLTLLFRISEKVATPTSVALMAGNTLVGTYWRAVMMRGISQKAMDFLFVCVPVVVLGAPLGSVIGSHFHRHILASFVYISDTIALICAFCLVKQTKTLTIMTVTIILTGFVFFICITKIGERLMKRVEERRALASEENTQPLDDTVDFIIETKTQESSIPWLSKSPKPADI